jgi:hypothetical protein
LKPFAPLAIRTKRLWDGLLGGISQIVGRAKGSHREIRGGLASFALNVSNQELVSQGTVS